MGQFFLKEQVNHIWNSCFIDIFKLEIIDLIILNILIWILKKKTLLIQLKFLIKII
jgi:hypothetical protein